MQHTVVVNRHRMNKCPKLPWMIDFHKTGDVLNQQLSAAYEDTPLNHLAALNNQSSIAKKRLTQILAYIPTKTSVEDIEALIQAGMSVAVIRTHKMCLFETELLIAAIRTATNNVSTRVGRVYSLAIALDISDHEIITGRISKANFQQIQLEKGMTTKITSNPIYENQVSKDMIYVNYEEIGKVVKPGDEIIIDGTVRLSAFEVAKEVIECIIERAGVLMDNLSVSLPNTAISMPVTENQEKFLKLAAEFETDLVFISHHMYDMAKELLPGTISLVLKLENNCFLDQFNDIVELYDGIMLDCDQLLVTQRETIFLTQKSLIARCLKLGKPCISVMTSSTMNKSFLFDLANAIMDGTDGVILQPDPELLESLSTLCKTAEVAVYQRQLFDNLANLSPPPLTPNVSLAIAAVEASFKCNAAAIILNTSNGKSVRSVARYRPRCPIIALTRFGRVAKQLMIYRGVIPFLFVAEVDVMDSPDRIFQVGMTFGKLNGYIKMGDAVVLAFGKRQVLGFRNSIEVVYASEYDTIIENQ